MIANIFSINDISNETILPLINNSLLASPEFLKIWEATGGRPVYYLVNDHQDILALLPGVEYGQGLFKRFQSLPDGLYANVYYNKSIDFDQKEARKLLKEKIEKSNYCKRYLFDYHNKMNFLKDYQVKACSTSLVNISNYNWVPPDKKLLSEIRKAEKEDFEIVPFDVIKHFDSFMNLMRQTESRHNRKIRYTKEFFRELAFLSMKDDRVVWLWCEYESQPVCSHINFIENNMFLNWQIYYDKKYSFLKVNQSMLYNAAFDAKKNGVTVLNLGASPLDAEGVATYKNKWGGVPYEYTAYYKHTLFGKLF